MRKNAFTLLEIIIVIIIVGILTSLALPRFFRMVEFSRSVEAISIIKVLRESYERCYLQTQNYDDCVLNSPGPGVNNLDILDPGLDPGAHFTYDIKPEGAPWIYRITAKRNNLDGGNTGDNIQFRYRVDGTVTHTGTGAFIGIK